VLQGLSIEVDEAYKAFEAWAIVYPPEGWGSIMREEWSSQCDVGHDCNLII